MVHDFLDGNIESARKFQLDSLHLISALFSEVNPIPVKSAINLLGYNFGTPRLPLTEATDKTKELLKTEMKKLEIL
jgi:4-hydroxy-tetrahydrodipicolinate synthase